MIESCKKQKNNVKIVVYSLDRFSHAGDNAIWLARQLRDLGIQIIFVTQPIDGILSHSLLNGVVEVKHEKLISRDIFLAANEEKNKVTRTWWAHYTNKKPDFK